MGQQPVSEADEQEEYRLPQLLTSEQFEPELEDKRRKTKPFSDPEIEQEDNLRDSQASGDGGPKM